jgi:1,4-alpha-glucan branching enzyme
MSMEGLGSAEGYAGPDDGRRPVQTEVASPPVPEVSPFQQEVQLLIEGRHRDPHHLLGLHDGAVRAWRPDAAAMWLLPEGAEPVAMECSHPAGLFEARLGDGIDRYRLEARDRSAAAGLVTEVKVTFDDPYRAWPTVGEVDLHLIGEGRHEALWRVLGARSGVVQDLAGTAFAVWAPNARSVRVVGDWNSWDGRIHPMRLLGSSGVWELFLPGVRPGDRYKYEVLTSEGWLLLKADPMAQRAEAPPGTNSVVPDPSSYQWGDADWLAARDASSAGERMNRPISIYEVHLGSWRRAEDLAPQPGPETVGGWRPYSYRELAEHLPQYVADLGFTHVELLPVAEHPFGPSWGYQVTSYYAPTGRYGPPDDFRALVDALHRRGIGVIIDWVPAHFPRDEWALARFDGTALYEHEDPRKGEHPDWGTLIFNYGRNEVRNFLVANALYWLEEFHIDGLRVDAVASLLYLDYSRNDGEWLPNQFGGREDLDAVAFLREFNEVVYRCHPGAMTIAEESTAWPAVSRPTSLGGLGFGFKWNMGWMHDTLEYFSKEPIHRKYHHNDLTFGLLYAWHENFILPISHDEVVHGKGSLLGKMPGDRSQQLANLRALLAWMWAHPGKQLLFMGAELGQVAEWSHQHSIEWHLLDLPDHRGVQDLVRQLNQRYLERPALWRDDFSPEGFRWIDANDADNSILSFLRLAPELGESATVACVANLTPVPRQRYRVGLPRGGLWLELLNTDAIELGGSGMGNRGAVWADPSPSQGLPCSVELTLPPLGVLWLAPDS